jgi:hypothetical protein
VYLGFMISSTSDEQIATVGDAVSRLARVEDCLCLGVLE